MAGKLGTVLLVPSALGSFASLRMTLGEMTPLVDMTAQDKRTWRACGARRAVARGMLYCEGSEMVFWGRESVLGHPCVCQR